VQKHGAGAVLADDQINPAVLIEVPGSGASLLAVDPDPAVLTGNGLKSPTSVTAQQ
jgi:hypothetical protein